MFSFSTKAPDPASESTTSRVPPGQYVTNTFPVMHYGTVPAYGDVEHAWDLQVWGEIASPARLSFAALRALPMVEIVTDIHCATRWSKLDTRWGGVRFSDFLQAIPALTPAASVVLAHGEQGFTANVPLDVLMHPEALLAYRYAGEDLTPDHGYPLRLLVPGRYFCKSVKWLRGLAFLAQDTPGFWERYGYHPNADPWREERYADDDRHLW
jgi:DMSO/TMAO reductase YedYZ molybdopterin-dependent catalytic subunit